MPQNYAITIITGIGPYDPEHAIEVAVGRAERSSLAVTITTGTGFHPQWGDEPVLVVTAFCERGAYRNLADDLRIAFSQEAVLYHAQPVPSFELVGPELTSDEQGIRAAIRALQADGWKLDIVYDGGEDQDVRSEQAAVEAITAVDDAYLWVGRGTEQGWVRFVMGNGPGEVINDHTVNLTALDNL